MTIEQVAGPATGADGHRDERRGGCKTVMAIADVGDAVLAIAVVAGPNAMAMAGSCPAGRGGAGNPIRSLFR